MERAYLGFDTSCYTTSCACCNEHGEILASERQLLRVPAGQNGLRQSDGVFQHVQNMPKVFSALMQQVAEKQVAAVCVSKKPMDDDGSYMPVFTTGCAFAQTVAQALGVPCFFTTHQRGHLRAAQIGIASLPQPYVAIHISGGTTDFLQVDEAGQITRFACSRDLHAGQLVDRIGVLLGLPFPCGKELERLAQGQRAQGRYAAIIKEGDCCLSGVEAQAKRDLEGELLSAEQVAIEIYDVLARSLLKVLAHHVKNKRHVLVMGGVASSQILRNMLLEKSGQRRIPVSFHFGAPQYSTDNAAGVAILCKEAFDREVQNHGGIDERNGHGESAV